MIGSLLRAIKSEKSCQGSDGEGEGEESGKGEDFEGIIALQHQRGDALMLVGAAEELVGRAVGDAGDDGGSNGVRHRRVL